MSAAVNHPRRRGDWLVPVSLVALSLVPTLAGAARLSELGRGAAVTAQNARFFAAPLPVVLHIVAVIPFSIIGAFQFSPRFRREHAAWHRRAGRVLLVCALITALSGLWMTQFYPWPEGDGEALYLLRVLAGSAMLGSILTSIASIRRRDFRSHGEWMTRAYAIGMGAGTQVLTHLPWFILFGKPTEAPRAALMGAGWAINIVVAEWIIRRTHRKPVRPTSHLVRSHS